tara:strand:- start:183 stop:377 length:195 start_codon:yes stop_codon:yes gene_type:complete
MKKDKFNKIIDEIEKCRTKNNVNWMNILRLAYSKAPKQSIKIFTAIYKDDRKISNLAKKLTKLK